jgi:hypothetical protein
MRIAGVEPADEPRAQGAGRGGQRARVYTLGGDGKPLAFNVRLGISDGAATELLLQTDSSAAGAFKDGTEVVIGSSGNSADAKKPAGGPRPPF